MRTVVLDHGIPCLAFALEEQAHVNVWKNRIEGLGLEVGQWLGDLKQAIARGEPDDAMITVSREANGRTVERALPLGELRGAAHVTPGQKIAYVANSAPTGRQS